MKGKITAIGISSSRVKAEIEAVQKELGLLESQDEAARPTSWEEAAEGLDIPQRQANQEIDLER